MLASVNPQMPIWDSIVIQNLGLKVLTGKPEQRICECVKLYDQIISFYERYLQTDEAKRYIAIFDTEFPEFMSISALKKIDFLIWGTRPEMPPVI